MTEELKFGYYIGTSQSVYSKVYSAEHSVTVTRFSLLSQEIQIVFVNLKDGFKSQVQLYSSYEAELLYEALKKFYEEATKLEENK